MVQRFRSSPGFFFLAAAAEVFLSSSVFSAWVILQEFKIFVLFINLLGVFLYCSYCVIIYHLNVTLLLFSIQIITNFAESCHPHTTLEDTIFSAEWLPFFISCHLATYKHTHMLLYAGLTQVICGLNGGHCLQEDLWCQFYCCCWLFKYGPRLNNIVHNELELDTVLRSRWHCDYGPFCLSF